MYPLRNSYIKIDSTSSITDRNEQMICFNCEETVARAATVCPYCDVQLTLLPTTDQPSSITPQVKESSKITPFQPSTIVEESPNSSLHQHESFPSQRDSYSSWQKEPLPEEKIPTGLYSSLLSYMGSLFFFLLGGALFLFGIIIFLFSKDDVFTLTWKESSWTLFIAGGSILICVGYIFLQYIDRQFSDE